MFLYLLRKIEIQKCLQDLNTIFLSPDSFSNILVKSTILSLYSLQIRALDVIISILDSL